MASHLHKTLPYKHISSAITDTLSYIDKRRRGLEGSLKTSSKKLNSALLEGVEWGRIFTLAGLSGSGKSLICEQLKRDFVDLNPKESFDILSFEFEMLAKDQVARNISGKIGKSTKYLYSGQNNVVSDEEYSIISSTAKSMAHYPIYYVDAIGSVEQISDTIVEFVESNNLVRDNRGLVVTVDHVLLTKGRQGQAEKQVVDELAYSCVALKKKLTDMGLKVIFILLSQLNRDIEYADRVTNPNLHYPTKNDIFGASSLFFSSDYVMVTHKPAIIEGIRYTYGPERAAQGFPEGLPVFNPNDPKQPMIYWHLLKERFGEPKILLMLDDFKNSRVLEY